MYVFLSNFEQIGSISSQKSVTLGSILFNQDDKTSSFTMKSQRGLILVFFILVTECNQTLHSVYLFCDKCTQTYSNNEESTQESKAFPFFQLAYCYPFHSLPAPHRFCSSAAGERGHSGAAGAAISTYNLQYCAAGLQENTGAGLSNGLDTQHVFWLLTLCTNMFHSAAFGRSNGDCRRVYNLSYDAIQL